jgi:pimeloyl-ACP methyl ester carboxylesterase
MMLADQPADCLDVEGTPIAYLHRDGRGPGVMWLGGFRSDMRGTKAAALDAWAARTGHAFTRHDYSGHGESGGVFHDGTISRWVAESLAVHRLATTGPQILVGSSMGAWIALRMTQELRLAHGRGVAGVLLLAPAPDFTSELIEPQLSRAQKRALARKGFFEKASGYDAEPYLYTRALIEDGRANRVLDGPIDTHCPVHIIQGMKDPDVPFAHALRLAGCLPVDDVTVSLVPDGDHRLSRPQDIDMISRALDELVARAG